jgi:hypothetical protein
MQRENWFKNKLDLLGCHNNNNNNNKQEKNELEIRADLGPVINNAT